MPAGRHWAEAAAERLLTGLGWRVLARNYRLRGGELDLICDADDGTVVFVEVRQRASDAFGGAAQSIDSRKLARLRRTAAHFLAYGLAAHRGHERGPGAGPGGAHGDERVRFDAVLVTGDEHEHVTRHVRDIL